MFSAIGAGVPSYLQTLWGRSLVAGDKEGALLYLSKFKWGKTFLKLNGELLDKYSACKSSSDVVEMQNLHLKQLEEELLAEKVSISYLLWRQENPMALRSGSNAC
ncbi:Ribosome biogenesis protein TSR3 [Portunus trituberculatus]|uniref:Ribosome biogenesis protein TSR3 n=1 Tax=Portunus trituberculatus TaxID=210409 RepID=A0A5B7FZA5_PORTR|nr:Ribosome biogenesis protein TSR3 [Portunus trituberculatus]